MVRGESNWVMELPWSSKSVMFRTVLTNTCGFEEFVKIVPVYSVIKVVLVWLLKLGGTKSAPTDPSPGMPDSSIRVPLEVRLEGEIMVTIKVRLAEGEEVADELIDGDLLSRLRCVSLGVSEGDSSSSKVVSL